MPYSCHAQFGRSGCSGCPFGGGRTVRCTLRSMDHSSTVTMVHTARRASFGSLRGGRSTIAEYGTRSLGSFIGPNPTFAAALSGPVFRDRRAARHAIETLVGLDAFYEIEEQTVHQPRGQPVVGAR